MKYRIVIILTFVFQFAFGQIDSCRTSTHIFWNNFSKIEMSSFQDSISTENYRKKCNSINLCWGACVGLWTIIDEPIKKRKRGKLIEQAYFVPAFEIAKSYRFNNDTIDYLAQLLIFDVYELAARKCRKDMESYFTEMPFYGTKLIIFKKVENTNKEFLNGIVGSITNDIYVNKKANAYNEWRTTINELLKETEQYKTSNSDRIRFINNKPLSKDYQMAKFVY